MTTRISRVGWNVLSIRNITEENRLQAEEKARKEKEAASAPQSRQQTVICFQPPVIDLTSQSRHYGNKFKNYILPGKKNVRIID